jgi:hypothetical protein
MEQTSVTMVVMVVRVVELVTQLADHRHLVRVMRVLQLWVVVVARGLLVPWVLFPMA